MRRALVERKTSETSVKVKVVLEGQGRSRVKTGIKFLDHMLTSLATHSLIDLEVRAEGDLQHHIVEDVALALGQALNKALGKRLGIRRFGHSIVPMDDALALAAIDLVRRPISSVQLKIERNVVEDAPREDLEHFFPSLTSALEATVHLRVLEGRNDHHKFESILKAFARALRDAMAVDSNSRRTPSSKGVM